MSNALAGNQEILFVWQYTAGRDATNDRRTHHSRCSAMQKWCTVVLNACRYDATLTSRARETLMSALNARSGMVPMTGPQMPEEYILDHKCQKNIAWNRNRFSAMACYTCALPAASAARGWTHVGPTATLRGSVANGSDIQDHHCYAYAVIHERKMPKCEKTNLRVRYPLAHNCANFKLKWHTLL